MVDGKRHRTVRPPLPRIGDGPWNYVEGKREGRWTIRMRNGTVREEFYRDDKLVRR